MFERGVSEREAGKGGKGGKAVREGEAGKGGKQCVLGTVGGDGGFASVAFLDRVSYLMFYVVTRLQRYSFRFKVCALKMATASAAAARCARWRSPSGARGPSQSIIISSCKSNGRTKASHQLTSCAHVASNTPPRLKMREHTTTLPPLAHGI